MTTTIANNVNQKANDLSNTESLAKKNEFQARRAEHQSKQAETQAKMAETQAGNIDLDIVAYVHRGNYEAEQARVYDQKAETEPEAKKKYYEAEATAAHKRKIAADKRSEATLKSQPYLAVVNPKKAKCGNKTIENGTISITQAKIKIREIESEANEAEAEARKAVSELKKAKLEWNMALEAMVLKVKHALAADVAETNTKRAEAEAKDRRIEAKARRDQSAAKMAEAKALRAGKLDKAEAHGREARVYKAKAIAQQVLIKEKRTEVKVSIKKTSKESQATVNQSFIRVARCAEKKYLSATGLLNIVREAFQEIPDQTRGVQGGKSNITLGDCLMSGLAVFSLKYPSLLQFNCDAQEGGCIRHNLQTLYKIEKAPSDTYMRERLDIVDPIFLRAAFKRLFAQIQRGKELEEYLFLDGHYLVSGDGTGYFSSKTIHCDNCCTKHHRDGSISYYHQMMSAAIVHPDHSTVIPFCPEAIINTDGSTKNDCERNASERLYRHIRREHPHLNLIVTEDALGSNGPHIRLLQELNMRFILVVKPDGNKSLFEFLNGVERQEHVHTDENYNYKIQFVNSMPINDSNSDLQVNFIELQVYDKHGSLEYQNTWITDIPITKANAYRLCQGGRAKWKIENETFNTLKNQGYHFEHNFGHGNKNLSVIFGLLMFLAFLIDQIQQSCCGLFQTALTNMQSKVRLWGRMQAYFTTLFIESWEKLWQGLSFGLQAGHLIPDMPTKKDTS